MPSDPKELMLLAARTNDLTGEGVQPWHLKATFQFLDQKGKTADQGIYEEFWVSPTKYKRIFTSSGFSQTEYGTQTGPLRAGVRDAAPKELSVLRSEFVAPIPSYKDQLDHISVQSEMREMGSVHLQCLSVAGSTPSGSNGTIPTSAFCIDLTLPAILISMNAGVTNRVIRSNIVRYQGHYLPRDLQGFSMMKPDSPGVPVLTAHLELLETIKSINEADFTPPANALPERKLIPVAESVSKAFVVDHPKPIYPPLAQAVGASGNVVLQATISTEGKVIKVGVLSGVPILQQAAIDCARKWTYKPYLLNGEAVEVSTPITIYFSPLAPRAF